MANDSTWDRVHTINDYFDGPLLGVADVLGKPHIYQRPFDEGTDEYFNFFLVAPIDADLLRLVLDDWMIWLRWHEAFNKGETTLDTHPALTSDRNQHESIKLAMGDKFAVNAISGKRMTAQFRKLRVDGSWEGAEVQWRNYDLSTWSGDRDLPD